MDAAKTDRDLGTYFAPEDRAWLWYNDTIETQAFALRVLAELDPADCAAPRPRPVALPQQEAEPVEVHARDGRGHLLARLVPQEGRRARPRARKSRSRSASRKTTFVFEPDRYTGKRNQVVVPGEKIDPSRDAAIAVSKGRQGPRVRLRDLALLDGEASGGGPRRLLLGLAEVLPARGDRVGLRAQAPGRGRRRSRPATRSRSRSRCAPSTPPSTSTCGTRAPPGLRARERPVPLQVGSRDLLVRGDARLRSELLLRAAPGRRVHVQVPRPREHGRDVQGRPGDGAVDVRARSSTRTRRGDGDGAVDLRR